MATVATGSDALIPPIDGLREVQPWTNREITTTKRVPERLLILGGGVVGVEMAQAFASLGSSVTLVEGGPRVLAREEPFASNQVHDELEARGVRIITGAKATAVERNGQVTMQLDGHEPVSGDVEFYRDTFVLDLGNSTQYGDAFSVLSLTQDGHTTGRLTGIDVSAEGIVSARYTNGVSQPLGQVALTNFANPQGLQSPGDNAWAETYESGQPRRGQAGSADFGAVQGGGLEASNVDLTEQLVNMITAQRNFQANAQMIQTQDQITQTVINIR